MNVRRFLLFVMLLLPAVVAGVPLADPLACTADAAETEEGGACEEDCTGCECCPLTPRLALDPSAASAEPRVAIATSSDLEPAPLRSAVPDEILHVPLA